MSAQLLAPETGETTQSFEALVRRLSEASVTRRWEAHRDIPWDAPGHEVDRSDPRWEAHASWDPLASCEWYLDQPAHVRSAIGLHRHARLLDVAIDFESVLSQGLLRFAARLPNRHPAFRYVYHEVSEEAQHSMMFQELIDRTGFDSFPTSDAVEQVFRRVAAFGEEVPDLFFIAVLAGEETFDHLQRRTLTDPSIHPLLATISRIHLAEEARHVSFARAFLRTVVPQIDDRRRRQLRYQVPFVLEWTAAHMFDLSDVHDSGWDMPATVREEVTSGPLARDLRRASMRKVVALCDELGLIDHRLDSVWSTIA